MILSTETIYNTFKNIEQDVFIKTIRDLTLIRVSDKHYMVIAVDSDGGIGPQEGDVVQIPAYVSGRFAIRVPLLEILSSGAVPVCAFDMLTMPMNEIGQDILRGVKDELKAAGLGDDFPVSGSTEDNVPTNMTGIGTTIVGMIHQDELRPGSSIDGDLIISVGKPKSGPDDKITLDDIEIISQESMLFLTKTKGVHDILPVGSHGVKYECEQIAITSGLSVEYNNNMEIDILKSGGPSTCVLASCDERAYNELTSHCSTPVFKIGKLRKE